MAAFAFCQVKIDPDVPFSFTKPCRIFYCYKVICKNECSVINILTQKQCFWPKSKTKKCQQWIMTFFLLVLCCSYKDMTDMGYLRVRRTFRMLDCYVWSGVLASRWRCRLDACEDHCTTLVLASQQAALLWMLSLTWDYILLLYKIPALFRQMKRCIHKHMY